MVIEGSLCKCYNKFALILDLVVKLMGKWTGNEETYAENL